MYEMLLAPITLILVFVLPGLSIVRIFRLPTEGPIETVFYSISLSFVAIVAIGFLLGNTVGITFVTVLVSFLLASLRAIVSISWKLRESLMTRLDLWKRFVPYAKRHYSKLAIVVVAAIAVTANWSYAIGTHPIDMGEHVYWAKVIVATTRMPNYYSVEPLDQAVKFTYGAHLVLAQFFLLSCVPIEEYSWIPTLVGSLAIWVGISMYTVRLTGSSWAGAVAAVLNGSAYQPFGYIERGNLPDIAGYLLLVSTLYSILRLQKSPSFSYALGLGCVSVIAYHQLATVILPIVIMFTIPFSLIRARSELIRTLRFAFGSTAIRIFWMLMLLMAFVYAETVTYVSSSAASQLVTGNWRPYVPAFYYDPLVPGLALGLLGTLGLAIVLTCRTLGSMLLLAWTSALVFLTNALLIGIPIPDPLRFLWRLTEPLSISGAVLAWFFLNIRVSKPPSTAPGLGWIRSNRRSIGAFFMIALIGLQIGGLALPTLEGTPYVLSFPPRYRPIEAFYQDDKRIGLWLGANASYTSVIANDADVDQTATWIEPYSMRLHFLFRADFATVVAPANYVQIYKSMKIMYENPSDRTIPLIIQRYNITYVIAHADEISLFAASPYFSGNPVFRSGESALFATNSTAV